jgi:hypothetical protein
VTRTELTYRGERMTIVDGLCHHGAPYMECRVTHGNVAIPGRHYKHPAENAGMVMVIGGFLLMLLVSAAMAVTAILSSGNMWLAVITCLGFLILAGILVGGYGSSRRRK